MNDHSKRTAVSCTYGHLTIVLRQAWIIVNQSLKMAKQTLSKQHKSFFSLNIWLIFNHVFTFLHTSHSFQTTPYKTVVSYQQLWTACSTNMNCDLFYELCKGITKRDKCLLCLGMTASVPGEGEKAIVTKSTLATKGVFWPALFSLTTDILVKGLTYSFSHSDSRVECSGFRVLRLVLLSSIIGFLFPVGVWQSISSRVCLITWSARLSWVTICSTFFMWGWPSLCKHSTSTWNKGKSFSVVCTNSQ